MKELRTIREIALDIKNSWPKLSPYAAPYVDAMLTMNSVDDNYYLDSCREVIARFLCNASGFRGEDARRIKLELREISAH